MASSKKLPKAPFQAFSCKAPSDWAGKAAELMRVHNSCSGFVIVAVLVGRSCGVSTSSSRSSPTANNSDSLHEDVIDEKFSRFLTDSRWAVFKAFHTVYLRCEVLPVSKLLVRPPISNEKARTPVCRN